MLGFDPKIKTIALNQKKRQFADDVQIRNKDNLKHQKSDTWLINNYNQHFESIQKFIQEEPNRELAGRVKMRSKNPELAKSSFMDYYGSQWEEKQFDRIIQKDKRVKANLTKKGD